jgi:zinc transport system substrate-binding protein
MDIRNGLARTLLALALMSAGQGQAADSAHTTHIVTSLKPIELMVRAVATENTRVTTLVPANASPHTYQMRPSERKALADADLIFWIGPVMETFLERLLTGEEFHGRAVALAPEGMPAVVTEHHDEHGQERGGHSAKAHDDHDSAHDGHHEEHEEHAEAKAHDPDHGGHDDHGIRHPEGTQQHKGHGDHHAHEHAEGHDPHIWLDPAQAMAMVERIHAELSQLPHADKAALDRNLEKFRTGLAETERRIQQQLNSMKSATIFTYHDAFSQFAEHYGLTIAGVMTLSPERTPGARHLAEIQEKLASATNPCLLTEPQFSRKWWRSITEGIKITMSTWDPLAADIPADAEGYLKFQQHLADAVTACL